MWKRCCCLCRRRWVVRTHCQYWLATAYITCPSSWPSTTSTTSASTRLTRSHRLSPTIRSRHSVTRLTDSRCCSERSTCTPIPAPPPLRLRTDTADGSWHLARWRCQTRVDWQLHCTQTRHVMSHMLAASYPRLSLSGKRRNTNMQRSCFTRKAATVLARLSHRSSVRPSVTRMDQSKTVQARITKSSPSAAWKTIVSGTVKLFHKFEGGHTERGR